MALRRSKPDWWRGTSPRRLPAYGNGRLLRGEVREFDSEQVPTGRYSSLRSVFFQQATGIGVEVALDEVHLAVAWSQFVRCTFRQRSGRLNAEGAAAQGSFGIRPSLYRDCDFVGVRFANLGRFSTGAARFEDCRFDRCRFNGHFSFDSDYIDCVFAGKIDGCVWYGTVPPGHDQAGRRNEFIANDFGAATFGSNVAWRGRFDFGAQRWLERYVPLADALE
jgi:hypothetical protein